MLNYFKKRQQVSFHILTQHQYRSQQGIQRIRVIKCPPNDTPQEYKNRNLILTLEIRDMSEI